ncbi:MAG: DUF3592 domain-containing protein [Verrucomicrobiales bacterium]|nr:DUF3592 domain-containing protein [Verrucomicrobiales bacterium]MCP5560778.1 DUF3592 domain-containing protein [Verrucomicrobiaceae bacterium]
MKKALPPLFKGLLVLFITIGCFLCWNQYTLWRDLPSFQEVTGKVEKKDVHRSGSRKHRSTKRKVTLTYTPAGSSTPITHTENVASYIYDEVEEGKPVQVFHDPTDPTRLVLVERSIGPWWSSILPLAAFILFPAGMLWWMRRPPKPPTA